MLLRHIHLRGLSRYSSTATLQDRLVHRLLAYKANPSTNPPPEPVIITAEFHPVYTCGRREVGSVTPEQQKLLTARTAVGQAEFHEALRGGQTTFHGPGQLVAYPIVDLKRHSLTARSYVCLLEKSVIRVCADEYGVEAFTTENPGVWTDDAHKICALGVHLRRNVSSHGIGLNVTTDLRWFDRIVACGLEGKMTTNLAQQGVSNVDVAEVGEKFVQHFSKRLQGVEGIAEMSADELD